MALTIVRRKVARHWRKGQRQERLANEGPSPEKNVPELLASLADRGADPARAAALGDAVAHMCRNLDETERRVLQMRLQGYRTVEVARELGLDADALRARLSRLRQRLHATGISTDWL